MAVGCLTNFQAAVLTPLSYQIDKGCLRTRCLGECLDHIGVFIGSCSKSSLYFTELLSQYLLVGFKSWTSFSIRCWCQPLCCFVSRRVTTVPTSKPPWNRRLPKLHVLRQCKQMVLVRPWFSGCNRNHCTSFKWVEWEVVLVLFDVSVTVHP